VSSPDPNWGSITNTSIEGGRTNPVTGIRGDWTGTVFDPIFVACGLNEDVAGMFYGNVWKKVIIERADHWVGIRSDPTFPNRGITAGQDLFHRPGTELAQSPKSAVRCICKSADGGPVPHAVDERFPRSSGECTG
jgi:hypothetical protein